MHLLHEEGGLQDCVHLQKLHGSVLRALFGVCVNFLPDQTEQGKASQW